MPESRAEYFRKRRETIGQFNVPIARELLEALDEKLEEKGIGKTQWLREKIVEELSDTKK